MSEQAARTRYQYGLRHLVLAIAVVATTLALVQRARMAGVAGEGARITLVVLLTTAGPLLYAFQCSREGRRIVRGGAAAGAVTGIALSAGLLGVYLGSHRIASDAIFMLSTQALAFTALMTCGGVLWGTLLGLLVRASLRRSRPFRE